MVQIENTEKLPPGPGGQQRVRIVKVLPGRHSTDQNCSALANHILHPPAVVPSNPGQYLSHHTPACRLHEWQQETLPAKERQSNPEQQVDI